MVRRLPAWVWPSAALLALGGALVWLYVTSSNIAGVAVLVVGAVFGGTAAWYDTRPR